MLRLNPFAPANFTVRKGSTEPRHFGKIKALYYMKKIFLISLILVQTCIAFAQNYCVNDTIVREIQFPLTERDCETVFYYFNNEWIRGAHLDNVPVDSIQKMEVKNDEYGNRALFLTVSPETLAQIKAAAREIWVCDDPQCEFPGGNGKLKEWLDENIRIPEGFKGRERVFVKFTVHPDGSISDATIYRRPSKNEAVNQEAIRLVNALPKFRIKYYTPQKKNLLLTLPITFKEPGAIFIRGDENNDNTHKQDSISQDIIVESKIFYEPEQQPYYLNGDTKGLLKDLYTTISEIAPVTQECVKGRAVVRFDISKDGQIVANSIKVLRNSSVPDDYLKAAIEAIKKLGKFEPGKMNGIPKKVAWNLPIIYPVPMEYIKTTE